MRRLVSFFVVFACSFAISVFSQEAGKPAVSDADPLDRLLADFAAAVGKFDVEAAEKLFLPPDNTPDGQNRQGHISELRKDWTRAKAEGSQGLQVEFTNTRKVIRTDMRVSLPGGPKETSGMEFVVELTRDGWKIASMNERGGRD
jgi:hypothetical protein